MFDEQNFKRNQQENGIVNLIIKWHLGLQEIYLRHYLRSDLPHVVFIINFTKKYDIIIKIDDMDYE